MVGTKLGTAFGPRDLPVVRPTDRGQAVAPFSQRWPLLFYFFGSQRHCRETKYGAPHLPGAGLRVAQLRVADPQTALTDTTTRLAMKRIPALLLPGE